MPGSTDEEPDSLLEPMLDYGCSPWTTSSQRAADLYDSGIKLWRKEDLVDIESQLAQSRTAEKFTVRRIDRSVMHIKNPMFGVWKPIWYGNYLSAQLQNEIRYLIANSFLGHHMSSSKSNGASSEHHQTVHPRHTSARIS